MNKIALLCREGVLSLNKLPLEKTSIPCSRTASFVPFQASFPAFCHGSNYPSLGTRCGSKLNQTIYSSGAAWLRYIMWFFREVAAIWKYVFAVVSPHQERERHGCLCQIGISVHGPFFFFFSLKGNVATQDGSSFFTDAIFWSPFIVCFLKPHFSMLQHANLQIPQNPFSQKFDFFQTSLNRLYAGKDLRNVFWGRIPWIHLFLFQDARKKGDFYPLRLKFARALHFCVYLLAALLSFLHSHFSKAALSHSTTGRKNSVSLLSHLNLQMRGAWRVVTKPFTNSAWLFSPLVPVHVHLSCKAPSPGRCPKATPEGWYVKTSNFFLFYICSLFNMNSSMSVLGTQTTGLFLCLQFMTSFSCCLLLIHKPPEVPSCWNGHGGLWSWEHRKHIRPS